MIFWRANIGFTWLNSVFWINLILIFIFFNQSWCRMNPLSLDYDARLNRPFQRIQLLSCHIENMQRICRSHLEMTRHHRQVWIQNRMEISLICIKQNFMFTNAFILIAILFGLSICHKGFYWVYFAFLGIRFSFWLLIYSKGYLIFLYTIKDSIYVHLTSL